MVSFQRMKEDLDDITLQVGAKLPGKTLIWVLMSMFVILMFVIGFGIGFGSGRGSSRGVIEVPMYYFVSNTSESCPPLVGDKLVTTVGKGQSFEGLVVQLQCEGYHVPFPLTVKCQRQMHMGESQLRWTNLPVCYPSLLVTPEHWGKVPALR